LSLGKHCPYCRHLVRIELGDKGGACDRCNKDFLVKYHLTKIKLAKIFIPRDYEAEIMVYVIRKQKTYAGEVSSHIGASKGVVSAAVHSMERKGLIKIIPRGKTKWIVLPCYNQKIR
jgi:predicted DNA-binding transcriptional regulator